MTPEERARPLAEEIAFWLHNDERPQDNAEKSAHILVGIIAAAIREAEAAQREASAEIIDALAKEAGASASVEFALRVAAGRVRGESP